MGGRTWGVLAALVIGTACSGPTAPPPPPPPPVVGPATAPVIRSISVPSARVEAGVDVAIAAVVEDAETPLAQLAYVWTSNVGTITGQGASAVWRMPTGATSGSDVVVTLTVIDTYDAVENNQVVKRQFVVGQSATPFRVHDSEAESKELARKFLIDLFGNSNVRPDDCMVDFADVCADIDNGRRQELQQIIENRSLVFVREATMLQQRVTWRTAEFGSVHSAVLYDDYFLNGSPKSPTCGDFEITVVYVNGRWWICQSFYNENDQTGCPASTDNAVFARTLGSQLGKSGRVLDIIKGRIR